MKNIFLTCGLIWPNTILNSNMGYTTHEQHFVNVSSDMTQSNTQFQYLGTSLMTKILLMHHLIWPNPIPNSNTWVHHSWQRICWCIIWCSPIRYPIPNSVPPPSPLQTKIRISFFWKPNSAPNLMTHQRAIMSIWIQYLSPMHDYTVPLKLIGNVNFGE